MRDLQRGGLAPYDMDPAAACNDAREQSRVKVGMVGLEERIGLPAAVARVYVNAKVRVFQPIADVAEVAEAIGYDHCRVVPLPRPILVSGRLAHFDNFVFDPADVKGSVKGN